MRLIELLLVISLGFSLTVMADVTPSPTASTTPEPFWKKKPEVYRKMQDERYIAVSARTEKIDAQKKLDLMAAGFIHADEDFVHAELLKLNDYHTFLPYVEESVYDAETHNLFVHGVFLGFHERMTIHITDHALSDGHRFDWESVAGSTPNSSTNGGFVGMTGQIRSRSTDSSHTEISLEGFYKAESIPLPDFILRWGLEFAMHRAAGSMRERIESQLEKSKKR